LRTTRTGRSWTKSRRLLKRLGARQHRLQRTGLCSVQELRRFWLAQEPLTSSKAICKHSSSRLLPSRLRASTLSVSPIQSLCQSLLGLCRTAAGTSSCCPASRSLHLSSNSLLG
ncbi:hypothetical protein EC988_008607, partial [Linderina pennispora]